ncbi:MAG: signal recognition particle protein [Firmicutes bacterium]|nr:signal recognition particle protein [Bacillota bacterium]
MASFGTLSEKLNHVFNKIKARGRLTELEIKMAMREIRIALLEADVNFTVVKDFVSTVAEKSVGEKVLKSLTPGQQVIKIVQEELIQLLGGTAAKLEVASKPPTVYMMVGLQGAGKTTMCGKLALMLKNQGKKPLLAACDIYRPAAINQLKVVGKTVGAEVFENGTAKPHKTAAEAVKHAAKNGFDTVIIDTAGRLHINFELMDELSDIKCATAPDEILLTVDAMTGQDAVIVAKSFNDKIGITGVILTKLDGDTRGGAALSIRAVTGKPIKLSGIGEKMGDLEPFHPDRIASRILGMGDVLTLIEKAEHAVTEEEAIKMEKKLRENNFTLSDFLKQFEQLKKMGNMADILGMIPGANKLKLSERDLDEGRIKRYKAIIQSMTPEEREKPEIIKGSRRKRISLGSGTTIQEVNQLLNQFEQTKLVMKNMKNNKFGKRMPF